MNRHGYGNDDQVFEDFRREKVRRRRDHLRAHGGSAVRCTVARETVRVVQEGEQRETAELRLRREMYEFVRDTTKIAASVLNEVTSMQAQRVEQQVSDEMREFFQSTVHGSEQLLGMLDSRCEAEGSDVAELLRHDLETRMTRLTPADLDRDGAEGGEEAAQLHAGEVPGMARDRAADDAASAGGFGIDEDIAASPLRPGASAALVDPLEVGAGLLDAPAGNAGETTLVPAAFGRLLEEPARARRVLTLLVRAGLLEREEARSVYLAARILPLAV